MNSISLYVKMILFNRAEMGSNLFSTFFYNIECDSILQTPPLMIKLVFNLLWYVEQIRIPDIQPIHNNIQGHGQRCFVKNVAVGGNIHQ